MDLKLFNNGVFLVLVVVLEVEDEVGIYTPSQI